MNEFEPWWVERCRAPALKKIKPEMREVIKRIAKEAWTEAFTLGYRKGVHSAEYNDGPYNG